VDRCLCDPAHMSSQSGGLLTIIGGNGTPKRK
jgi:hypothetical protein